MKIMSVVGARPNFMKVAPIIRAIEKHNSGGQTRFSRPGVENPSRIEHVLVHTGQHYDAAMSDSFFTDLNLPPPDIHLGVGAGSATFQTAEILKKFEEALLRERPDVVLVVGDVNSTLACSIVTAKSSFDASGTRPLLVHVEAGLRSFDRSMPEEVNRIVTDHLCDMFFVTEESGLRNLLREGIPAEATHFVGNTMIDSLMAFEEQAAASPILEKLGLRTRSIDGLSENASIPYALLTLHRPANVDNRQAFVEILEGLDELSAERVVVFPVHPRTQNRIKEFGLNLSIKESGRAGIMMTNPLGYLDFLCLMKNASMVVTDSGGIQEETTCLGIPCVTVRANTERPVTIERGTNVLAGIEREGIRNAIERQLESKPYRSRPENWDGQAAERIVEILSCHKRDVTIIQKHAISLCS
jgi:UDP-N-acetylglucosamine 2-epimerase (non-hydrolysing)